MRHYLERGQDAEKLEREVDHLEAQLDDVRRQMYARDDIEEKVDVLANRIQETQAAADAPFFIRWGDFPKLAWL